MNKLLNDYQFLELENAELRNRIAELKATSKYPQAVFSLHSQVKDGITKYIIFNHKGEVANYFYADSEHIAVQIFNTYKKRWKPTLTEVIANDYDDMDFYSLVRFTATVIQDDEVKEMIFYVMYINDKDILSIGNCPEDEAIKKYQDTLFERMNRNLKPTPTKRLI